MNMSRSLCEHLRVCGNDLLTLHDQSDGLHAGVGDDIVAGKLGQALDAVKETVQDIRVVLGELGGERGDPVHGNHDRLGAGLRQTLLVHLGLILALHLNL